MLIFKAKEDKKPVYFHSQISAPFNVNTRLAVNNGIRETRKIKLTLGKQSVIPRSISQWNNLPMDIRAISARTKFKSWVKKE